MSLGVARRYAFPKVKFVLLLYSTRTVPAMPNCPKTRRFPILVDTVTRWPSLASALITKSAGYLLVSLPSFLANPSFVALHSDSRCDPALHTGGSNFRLALVTFDLAMSAIHTFIRKLNFTQLNTPGILRVGQQLTRNIGTPEVAAAARWGVALGLVAYWMIEPNFEDKSNE